MKYDKEVLSRLILGEKKSYEEIGRMYGITGNAVKKNARRLGISLPKRRKINKKEHFGKGEKRKRDATRQTKTTITNNTSKVYSISNESFTEIINNNVGWVDVCKKLGYKHSGSFVKKLLKKRCEELGLTLNLNGVIPTQQRTKGELKEIRKNYQSYRSSIRKKAELVFKNSGKECKCEVCGYNKHIEIAHKKAVSDFDDSATIAEINDINNLIALCPNCHWEFDNGLLKL